MIISRLRRFFDIIQTWAAYGLFAVLLFSFSAMIIDYFADLFEAGRLDGLLSVLTAVMRHALEEGLLTVLFVMLGHVMAFWLAGQALGWVWRKVRPRKPAPKKVEPPPAVVEATQPEPPRTVAEMVQPEPYELHYKIDNMCLSWEFKSALERDQFRLGFREGFEYQIEALKQRGKLPSTFTLDYSPVEQPNRHDSKRPDQDAS